MGLLPRGYNYRRLIKKQFLLIGGVSVLVNIMIVGMNSFYAVILGAIISSLCFFFGEAEPSGYINKDEGGVKRNKDG